MFGGCAYSVQDLQFKSRTPDTLWDRALSSVEQNCNGIKQAAVERLFISSKWQAWHTSEGLYLTRCLASFVQEGREVDVRVAFTVRQCPPADMADLDALAEYCAVTFNMPESVAAQLNSASKKLEFDLRR